MSLAAVHATRWRGTRAATCVTTGVMRHFSTHRGMSAQAVFFRVIEAVAQLVEQRTFNP